MASGPSTSASRWSVSSATSIAASSAFRRFVREFALSGDENLIAEARKQQEALAKSVKQGLDEIKNPERRARMTEISEQFEKYAKNFDKLVALKQEQNKLTTGVLDPLGAKYARMIEELQTMLRSRQATRTTRSWPAKPSSSCCWRG